MTSVEKRRSGRKSGGHRKHSDGGYSDTSSGGSFLDETDREVSNLTDRAFRSLCIGDEAVYNDSDLCSSSPCIQRDRQLAFSQSCQDRDREDREREELKRAAHEGFSLRVQQYGQNWMHGGMCGAEIQRDPQWGVYGERTQGRVSATFQHSFVEMSQQEKSLNEEQLSFFSNGPTELGSQQRRSRSRVSSLIRAFNSEGQRDGAGMDVQSREWNDETSWDKTALMSIQRELSEFSTPYQQNFDSGYFPPAGPFLSQDSNFYSTEVAAMAHINSTSSFMRSSHSMLTQVNCNSNFFIHSEFSPFRVWRDHNRFPFQQGEVSGFMHCSDFPKWCETPMYKELSQGPSMFEERRIRHQRNTFAPMVPLTPSRSTSTSTMLQKASTVENRSESELSGHYPYRKRTQSLGNHRLPSQRPSTASPTIEMSRRVRDTISSVKALQQRIKMMTEQNVATELTANTQGVYYNDENLMPYGSDAVTVAPNQQVSSNASTTAFNISHLLTPQGHAHQETSDVQKYEVSPQPVEHPPVRAESRGATPDVRMSSYRSRATSLLFNLKDNRKRVKSTYSPTKFKGLEMQEKSKQSSYQEPRDTVIDIPEFADPDKDKIPQVEDTSIYISREYETAQVQDEMVHHSGLSSYIPDNQLANGQNLHEDSFTPYKQDRTENPESLGGDLNRPKPSYKPTEMPRLNAENNQVREYLTGNANTQQHCNEAVGQKYTKVDRYQPLKEYNHDYSNVSSQDKWRQTNIQDTEKLCLNAANSPWKQGSAALMEKDQHTQEQQKSAMKKENKEIKQMTQNAPPCNDTGQNPAYGQQQSGAFRIKENYLTANNNRYADQEYKKKHTFCSNEDKAIHMQETGQSKQYAPTLTEQRLQPKQAKQQFEHNMQKNSLSVPDKAFTPTMAKDGQFIEVKAAQDMAKLTNSQPWAQVEEPKAEPVKVILSGQTDSEQDSIKQAKAQLNMDEKAQAERNEAEQQREEQRREKQAEQPKEKTPREELIKTEQARAQSVKEGPRNVTEKAGAKHSREEQDERVKAEQADAQRLKEEHIKTEMEKNEQAKTEQAENQKEQVEVQLVRTEKDEREQTEAEQIRLVKVKAELAEAEHKKDEGKLHQMKLQQVKSVQEKTKVVGEGNVKTEHKVEDVNKKKAEEASIQVDQVNVEQPKTEKVKEANAEVRKAEQAKMDQTKLQLGKAEVPKTQKLQDWPAKSTAVSQHGKTEPSKVEQVKTELAKAKAELAKIKNKMKGDQKEKVRSTVITKGDDNAMSDVPSRANISKNEEQDQAIQLNKQKKDSKNSKDSVADDYESLLEKYGLTDATSTNKNRTAGNISLNDVSVTPALAMSNMSSKDEYSPTSKLVTPKTENKEELGIIKSNVVSESQYIYSESSKEFKLSSANNLTISADNSDSVTDKVKDDGVDKLGNGDHLKHADISQQRVSDSTKPLERKPKSTEHSVVSGFTPPRALIHKDRAQTKQEILTSKIKAHAEKEISAIKEKGFALRDGFASKNSNKLFSGSQSMNIRQKPLPRRHENTMPINTTSKQQMGPSGIQMEPVKPNSLSSSATITSQILDPSQKQGPIDPMKRIGTVPEVPKEAKLARSHATITDGSLIESQKKEDQPLIKSPAHNKDLNKELKINKGKQEIKHGETSEKLKEVLMNKTEINSEQLNKKKEDPSQATTNHERNPEDSSPSLKLSLSQNEMSVADDSLQIMGIMVTVRERINEGQGGVSTQVQTHPKKQCMAEPGKCYPTSGVEVSKEKDEAKDRVAQKTNGMKNHPQNMQETPTRKNNVTENVTEKQTPPLQESSYIHVRPQREIQLQEPLTEKDVPPSVTVPAKNKVLAETQPHLKQDIIAREKKEHTNKTPKENLANIIAQEQDRINREEKNPQITQTQDANKKLKAKVGNMGINFKDDFNRPNAKSLVKYDIQPSMKIDMTTDINLSKSRNIADTSVPLLEEKRYDSTPLKTSSKTNPSYHLTENENRHVPVKLQHKETHIGENDQVDSTVHIDSIAIKVMPPVTEKDNQKMMGKNHITAVSSDVVVANEREQVQSSSHDEKVSTLTKEDHLKDPTPTSCEKQMKDKLESNQLNRKNVTSEKTHIETGKPKKVKDNGTTKTQPMEGDYFQIQRVTETKDAPNNKNTNVGDKSDTVSKRGELPNMAAISKESCKEEKHEAFALDQSKMNAVEICPVSIQDENMKTHSREIEDKIASKPSDCPTERQNSKCENIDASQAIPTRKHQTESKSCLLAKERHILRNSQPTRENAVKEKPEVKPKPKERASTIPDISALADYARLKVIVSEETANTIQDFPPNKKEGFFPLIQSRHSRRPVFTADPQDLSVKEKHLPSKTEIRSKVNKELKPIVFPITEKEHQKTGMFKLGEKERQEKMLLDVKDSEGVETGAKHSQDVTERNKSPQAHIKNQEVVGVGYHRLSEVDHQPTNHSTHTTTSASSVNNSRNASVSQHLKSLDTSNPHEKTAEIMTNLDRDSHPKSAVEQMNNLKESKTNTGKDEKIKHKDTGTMIGEDRTENPRQETPHEETTTRLQNRAKQLEEAPKKEVRKRADDTTIKKLMEESRASLAEEERRVAQREEERRAREKEAIAIKIKERREKQKEAERRAEEERKAKQVEEDRAAAKQREEERKMKEIEKERRTKIEEERRAKLRAEEEWMKKIEEKRRVKRREEERAAQEEQQKKATFDEEQRQKAKQAEEERRLALMEEERKRKQREEERAAQEEQQKRAALMEEQRRKAKEIEEEKAAQEEQRRAKQLEEETRLAHMEEERRRKQREEERAAQEEQQKRAALMEEQRRKAKEIEEKRIAYIEEERKRKQMEEEKTAQEAQRRIKQIEEENRLAYIEEERKRKQSEKENAQIVEETKIKQIQEQRQIEEKRRERQKKEEWIRTQKEEDRQAEEQAKAKEERVRLLEDPSHAQRDKKRAAQEQLQAEREEDIRAKKRDDEEEEGKLAAQKEEAKASWVEEQKRALQRMDALQYYAITSTESERKPRQRQVRSPIPSHQRSNTSESTDDSGFYSRPHSRSHASASPAPSLPRSNTSSPALGTKPLMFRVKDNTLRGSPFTKSVKPRFHKNFGEDFRVGSPMERGEEEQEIMRRNTSTPIHPDTTPRLAAIKESSILEPASSSQDYSAPLPHHRPFSRRSFALDEEDSRSVISYMSEDVESFATSAADLADIRGLYDNERPESACSFSSDVSRLGKPPVVPPKSEKALLRAKRLTRRRMKKELAKVTADIPAEKSLQEVSSTPSSSSEVRSYNRHAVASPHFSPPVSLAHAPALGSGLPSSHTEQQHSHRSFHASPHATTSVSLPVFSPHATTAVSHPDASPHAIGPVSHSVASPHAIGPVSHSVASPHAIGPVSHPAALKTIAHGSSSPTFYQANHPAPPVTQYHVESRYPQSYPLTQRKVLQDLGSGQYFVVDVPVQVKTKTFFDPETGSYVQLNVRESGQSTSRPQSQKTYPQPQLQPQIQVKQQQQPLSQASPPDKPFVLYQGYHGYSQGYQPTGISSVQPQKSSSGMSAPVAPLLETYRQQAPKSGQNSEGHCYSPERTPYMDTVNDKDRTHNTVYNTHGSYESFPECDTNSQLVESSVCENDNSAHSRYQAREIITMGDLEDFMEVSDW